MAEQRKNDELASLLEGLPSELNSADTWVQAAQRQLGRSPNCPPLTDLLADPQSLGGPRAAQVATHAATCAYCLPWVQGRTRQRDAATAARTYAEQLRDLAPELAEVTTPALALPSVREHVADAASVHSRMTGVYSLFARHETDKALATVRPYLAFFLRGVGLVTDLADRLEAYLRDHGSEVVAGELLLTQWLRGFATTELGLDELPYEPTLREWELLFERGQMERLLEEGLPGKETTETRFFRQAARERQVSDLRELEALQLEYPTPASYPAALEKELRASRRVWGSYLVQPRKAG